MTSMIPAIFMSLSIFISSAAWADKHSAVTAKMSAAQLIAAADGGNAEAQYAAAALILRGGMPANGSAALRDPARVEALAVTYLKAAAARGSAPAQHLLGTLHMSGRGVAQDSSLAKKLFLSSAEAGNSDGQNALGQLLRKGAAGTRDDKAAVAWFEKASAAGNMLALTNLGYMHSNGYGVFKGPDESA